MERPNAELYHHGVLGMKWGVRRYQNKDGSLTEAGQKRYDRDVRENNARKKDSRIQMDGPDPKRWAREDIERTKRTLDSANSLVKNAKDIEKKLAPKFDLSKMSDQELREKINRAQMERQYAELFADTQSVSRGRETVRNVLDVSGTVLTVASSAVGLALAIKQMKG